MKMNKNTVISFFIIIIIIIIQFGILVSPKQTEALANT